MSLIIDGKAMSLALRDAMKENVSGLVSRFGRKPSLAVVIVGDDPASRSYVRGKIKAAEYIGIESRLVEFDGSAGEAELLSAISKLNADADVDAILVQLPLPEHISSDKVIDAISLEKDVDGFSPVNVANLQLGRPCTAPCTPKGIIRMIESTGTEISGKRAVVVGRSNIVGKPVAKMLLDRNATVTTAHSKTADLASVCREADILVVAAGCPHLISADMVKPGAVVIDVGINRVGGKLVGDVDFDAVSAVAGAISPVPGGVGPMTITMLMDNTIECFLGRMCR